MAPAEVKEKFNRLVILALEDFAIRRRKNYLKRPWIGWVPTRKQRRESIAVHRNFLKAEGDGLGNAD